MKMDDSKAKRNETVQDIPPVPIKTYKWEDVRREKRKGHYPYTYLHKEPYNEEIDPSEYKMDTLKTSKSASVLQTSHSGVNIQEIVDNKDPNSSKDYLDVHEGIVEGADSSNEDNISQYLDRDDDPPVITEHVETPGPSNNEESMEVDDKFDQRAKSEEPKRKRKLSIESSYSRISLSKLGVMKKLREAKEKLKLPKFSFSKSESKLDIPKKPKKEKEKKTTEKDNSKKANTRSYVEPKKNETPVYIHIPLKPPPGQTDEFSYLEFEDRKSSPTPKQDTSLADKSEQEKLNGEESVEKKEKEGVQFIILTAPSDDEKLDDNILPDSTSPSDGNKKFFENANLKDLKTLTKGVDDISPDMPIEGIIFEDVIQVEYVDEHNRPIGTTEHSNFLEITEENLPKIEKQLSQRNLVKELEKEITTSMDSLHKIVRNNTLKKLKDQQKARSIETLKKITNGERKTQEAPELTTPTFSCTIKEIDDKSKDVKSEVKKDDIKEEKKEVPKASEEKPETDAKKSEPEKIDNKAMFDEEDGLKLSETAVQMINEELAKEKLPQTTEEALKAQTGSIRKKVSFKRRSKQEDPHGIYEDVRVTSDDKKVDGKQQSVKELKVMEPTQSMSADEEKTYLDDKMIKTTSLEEDYNKWSKLTDHEYEPINPPAENTVQQLQTETAKTPVKRTSAKPSKKSPSNSIRIPLKAEDIVPSDEEVDSGDALTAEEMQARIEDQFFNSAPNTGQQEGRTTTTTTTGSSINSKEGVPQESQAKKFQDAIKTQAGKLRTKMKNIKKPNLHMPQKPNLERFKIQKPNITMPKIPDQMRVNLPSFTLPKKSASAKKRSVKERQLSTESNAGDSKKKLFDFSTYPRIFGKKKKSGNIDDDFETSATVPRAKKSSKKTAQNLGSAKEIEKKKKSPEVIRIPLHSKESMDKEDLDLSSHGRYDEDIDMDDEYLKENQQIHTATEFNNDFSRNRWNHGSFHGHNLNEISNNENEIKVTDLDNDIELPQTSPEPELEIELPKQDIRQTDQRCISSTGDIHRQGVLEKINSDEYFIREKGISQDNIQMGELLTAEIREAFKQPINSLAKIQTDDSFDREFDISDQSIQEVPKRRPIKKPKRKKTPNVSKERIPYDQESEPDEYPIPFNDQPAEPARPKRRSKQKKKIKEDRPPYQETMPVRDMEFDVVIRKAASDNILLSDKKTDDNHLHNGHFQQEYPQLYENENMHGIEQPNILISEPYDWQLRFMNDRNVDSYDKDFPEVPPRKQRSMKSLTSEQDSLVDEINLINQNFPQQTIEAYRLEHEYIIPMPEEPPIRPSRTRSSTRSESRGLNQYDDEQLPPMESDIPCVEEPCVQLACDYMGYAVIDKNKQREPPLPPPARKKKSSVSSKSDTKFSTVPRPLKDDVPVRPLRNYSTLVPRSKRSTSNLDEEEKENVNLGQYIEIDDEDGHSRLQSGDIVQKMKDRPLPAPPRPPRKTKDSDKDGPFKDITHNENIDDEEQAKEKLEETEVSVQTEPLPDDFVCEEFVQEKGDRVITPTYSKAHPPITEFENIETVTHGALVVAPVPENFQEGPITNFSRSTEKIITIRREVDHEEEDSEAPENFKKLKDPQPQVIERIIERPIHTSPEVEILKAHKLQVGDLDVDRLMVNELLASKIKVSEIDGDSISVTEINPKSGNLVIGGLELPVNFIQDILEKLRTSQCSTNDDSTAKQSNLDQDGNKDDMKPDVPIKEKSDSPSTKERSDISSKDHNNLPSKTYDVIADSKDLEGSSKQAETDSLPLKQEEISLSKENVLSELQEEASEQIETTPDSKETSDLKEDMNTNIQLMSMEQSLKESLDKQSEEENQSLQVDVDLSSEVTSPELERPDLSLKLLDEGILAPKKTSIEDEADISRTVEAEKIQSFDSEELSPITIQSTINYLDDLIKAENITLGLDEGNTQIVQGDLEDMNEPSKEDTLGQVEIGEAAVAKKQSSVEETSESVELEEVPPLIPDTSEEERLIEELKSASPGQKKTPFEKQVIEPPKRPPRQSDIQRLRLSQEEIFIPSQIIENSHNLLLGETPPPRPPDPEERLYLRSQPPPSFYALSSPILDDFVDDDIPMPPRRKRPQRPPSRSSSEETPQATSRSRRHRTPEPSIPQLTCQLSRACVNAGDKAFKRLIKHITTNVLRNADGRQDLHVMILMLLVLIAGLILLGDGGSPIIHHHHWEYFNPPKDL